MFIYLCFMVSVLLKKPNIRKSAGGFLLGLIELFFTFFEVDKNFGSLNKYICRYRHSEAFL